MGYGKAEPGRLPRLPGAMEEAHAEAEKFFEG